MTAYDEEHEKDLHLIVVRRDLTGYQHVHPTLAADGTWTTDARPDARALAASSPTSRPPAARRSPSAPTSPSPATTRPPTAPGHRASDTVDGYTVDLDGRPRRRRGRRCAVSRDGEPVTDLEPYLGAYGHLVALREGDLAYLHVHPRGRGRRARSVPFAVEVPSAGGYRLFFDFKHDGVVRTAALTVRSRRPTRRRPTADAPTTARGGDGPDDH